MADNQHPLISIRPQGILLLDLRGDMESIRQAVHLLETDALLPAGAVGRVRLSQFDRRIRIQQLHIKDIAVCQYPYLKALMRALVASRVIYPERLSRLLAINVPIPAVTAFLKAYAEKIRHCDKTFAGSWSDLQMMKIVLEEDMNEFQNEHDLSELALALKPFNALHSVHISTPRSSKAWASVALELLNKPELRSIELNSCDNPWNESNHAFLGPEGRDWATRNECNRIQQVWNSAELQDDRDILVLDPTTSIALLESIYNNNSVIDVKMSRFFYLNLHDWSHKWEEIGEIKKMRCLDISFQVGTESISRSYHDVCGSWIQWGGPLSLTLVVSSDDPVSVSELTANTFLNNKNRIGSLTVEIHPRKVTENKPTIEEMENPVKHWFELIRENYYTGRTSVRMSDEPVNTPRTDNVTYVRFIEITTD